MSIKKIAIIAFFICSLSVSCRAQSKQVEGQNSLSIMAQYNSRLGIIPQKDPAPYTMVPCGGPVSFSQDWSSGVLGAWTTMDFDTLTPRPETGLSKGWQMRKDYNDTTNWVVVSPSWYVNPGSSDDWLISPQIPINSGSCLSWRGSSQDENFKETYEVRISTTTPDTAGFFANVALDTITNEFANFDFHSIDMSAWSGQNVYIAFRQISNDKFVLVLDDFSISSWQNLDAGVSYIQPASGFGGSIIEIKASIANYGIAQIQSVDVLWSIDGGPANTMNMDSIFLDPGDTLFFTHSIHWFTDTVPHIYDLCMWTNLPNTTQDQFIFNDTTCISVNVGDAIAIDPRNEFSFSLFPNPSDDYFLIEVQNISNEKISCTVFNLVGEEMMKENWFGNEHRIEVANLPSGTYFVMLESASGVKSYSKIIVF